MKSGRQTRAAVYLLTLALVGSRILAGAASSPAKTLSQTVAGKSRKASEVNLPVLPARSDRVDRSVGGGVEFLMTCQRSDGSILDRQFVRYHTALTSLAVLAMADAGHEPADKTVEGLAMRRGLDFVLRADRQLTNGYFGQADQSMMYGHGLATLLLTEVLAMGLDPERESLLRQRSRMAVDLIVRA
jgi:hypothetical protein